MTVGEEFHRACLYYTALLWDGSAHPCQKHPHEVHECHPCPWDDGCTSKTHGRGHLHVLECASRHSPKATPGIDLSKTRSTTTLFRFCLVGYKSATMYLYSLVHRRGSPRQDLPQRTINITISSWVQPK